MGSNKKSDKNRLRDSKGRYVKGHSASGPGRPPGTGGRQQLAKMILQAFDERGGVEWLKKLKDRDFVNLVKPLIPKNIELSGPGGGPIELEVLLRQAKERAAKAREANEGADRSPGHITVKHR